MDWFPTMELRRRAQEITEYLVATYHVTFPKRDEDAPLPPVDELVLTLLSQSTTDVNSWRGYQALRARFPDWEAAAEAPVELIEEAIRSCGLARQKAPRLKAILQQLRAERGRVTLDFLRDLPPDEALAYLMAMHGVGRKTASCVLLFSLGMPAMPVDTHVYRVTRRLELIPQEASPDQAHDMLECLLDEENYLPFHINMIAHGRQTCTAQRPACERCVLLDLCRYGQRALGMPESETGEEEPV